MSCHWGSVTPQVRPGSARVLVTELSGSGHINPTPAAKPHEDSDTVVELYLSPEKLELLCGTQDLSHVTSLEICVDTQENTLGNFGVYLPKLEQLNMNNSVIMSVRDLGTTLSHLQVLWMSRCCLQDLDGISILASLRELYLAYNSLSDLSQVGMLENLGLLDLEGNDVDDIVQVQYLGLCSKLRTLTLEGNPVCVQPNPNATTMTGYSYRAAVRELVPQLHYLDDMRVEDDGLGCSGTMGEEWAILRNSIRNSSQSTTEDEETTDSGCPSSRPSSARRTGSSQLSTASSRPFTGSRPNSATTPRVVSSPGLRPGSADSGLAAVEADTSILTHGAGKILFCGNPIQAIRARREKLKTAPARCTPLCRDPPLYVPEHTYDLEEPDVKERGNVFAELRAWREQHSRRLQALERERLPQVMVIQQKDEKDDDEEDEEGFGGMRSDEEHREDDIETNSPDSSFRSLSPDQLNRELLIPRLLPSPDTSLSPSPPPSATAASGNRRIPGMRVCRLRVSHLPHFSGEGCLHGTRTATARTDLTCKSIRQVTRTDVPLPLQPEYIPHPPKTSIPGSCAEMDLPSVQGGNKHQMSKVVDTPVITRPHTARAALQKHPQHRIFRPCRGSSHPD